MSEVLVVGAGIAGTAAALAAAATGARVTVIDGGPGATVLATGGLDGESSARDVLEALGVYMRPAAGVRLLTTAGVVREASGCDAALLDVGAARGPVAAARCLRLGWDADALARSWNQGGDERFMAIDVRALRQADERSIPDADFAARHDDEARLGWLELRVREALAASGRAFAAVVLPPCLGVDRPRAEELSRRLGLPCGEAIAAPGGPSGLRFERARDRAFAAAEVGRVAGRVLQVEPRGSWRVVLDDGRTLEARSVVLATGGFLGGGLAYAAEGAPVRASLEAPVTLGARGRAIDTAASLFGGPPEEARGTFAAGRALERAGVMADSDGRCAGAPPGLFAAGEAVADAPRTWLGALDQGARAGRAAARVTSAEAPSAGPGPGSPSPP